MAITLKQIKKWNKFIARSKMTNQQLLFFDEYIIKRRKETEKLEQSLIYSVSQAEHWVIISPIYIPVRKKTVPDWKISLNLNWYRNVDFIVNNNMKIIYKDLMKSQLQWKTFKTPIEITYKLYYSAATCDLMNITAIVDKFFCDTLQELWCIPEDNVKHLTNTYSSVWWKDIEHPRMEISILQ